MITICFGFLLVVVIQLTEDITHRTFGSICSQYVVFVCISMGQDRLLDIRLSK